MELLKIITLDKTNAAPFAPYLLPAAREAITANENVIAVGAADDCHIYGAAAAEARGDELRILSLFADKTVRRRGIGKALLQGLAEAGRAKGESFSFAAADYMIEDEDEAAIAAFLVSMGFSEPELSNRLFSVNTAKLHRLPIIGAAFSTRFQDDPHVHPYAEITQEQLKEIEEDSSVPDNLKPGAVRHPILKRAATIWVEDGHVLGWLVGYQGFDGGIVMSAACKRAGAPKGCFHKLLLSSTNRCYMMLGHDFNVYISTVNDHSGSLVEKIAGGTQKEYAHYIAATGADKPEWL